MLNRTLSSEKSMLYVNNLISDVIIVANPKSYKLMQILEPVILEFALYEIC